MDLPRHSSRLCGFLVVTSAWLSLVVALDLNICSGLNTASMQQNVSIFQTNGLCRDFCVQSYAYAITQGTFCWCSNFTPDKSRQVDKSRCNKPCPAFPPENCGGDGVYGYISLPSVLPSGTMGAEERTPSSTTNDESTGVTVPPSSTMVQTVTADGTVKTVTIIPTMVREASKPTDTAVSSGGLGTGGVVGIVVGVVVGIVAVAGLILFFFFRYKKLQDVSSTRGSLSGIIGGRTEMSGAPGSPGSTGNRSSTLQIDPRMDPFKQGLYARSGSHESVNTLRDDHDYSRRIQQPKVLRATNPDPDDN